MAIRMKIPRSNIYLQSGSLFFTKDSFQVSLYTVRTRYRDCIILLFASIFSSFSLATSQLLFPEATGLFRNTFIFFLSSERNRRLDAYARGRKRALTRICVFPLWKVATASCYYPSTSMEKGLLSAVVNSTLKDSSRTAVCIPRFFSYAIVRPASRRTAPWNRRHACKNHRYDNDHEDVVKFLIA